MMKRFYYIIIILLLLPFVTTACIEDSFTTSTNDTLAFSTDTLAFDTMFTDVGTATYKFTVYNRHKKMLNISGIRVKGESEGKFSLNVDGVKGKEFSNIEIRGEDSIFVFVEAFINPSDRNNPIEIKDKIEFITNNVTQNVVLTAWGQDVIRHYGTKIKANTTFTAEKPYLIFDTLVVEKDVVFTLEPGTTLYFHDKAAMKVDGRLIAKGSKDAPINMRGDRLDKVVGGLSYDIMSGQWGGVTFSADSYENEMEYLHMRGSSTGVTIDSCNIERRKLNIFNSLLRNASTSVLSAKYAWVDAMGSEFADSKDAVTDLTGGKFSFINCTFANYYLFSAISSAIITMKDLLPADKKEAPLMEASFDNCVIYGNTADVKPGDLTDSKVMFRYCLLKANGSDDNNFISCKWKGDPKFYTVREEYIFDSRLQNESDAIALGNRDLCPEVARYDRYGNDRFIREGIDLGAYTWVPKTEEEKQKK